MNKTDLPPLHTNLNPPFTPVQCNGAFVEWASAQLMKVTLDSCLDFAMHSAQLSLEQI